MAEVIAAARYEVVAVIGVWRQAIAEKHHFIIAFLGIAEDGREVQFLLFNVEADCLQVLLDQICRLFTQDVSDWNLERNFFRRIKS